MQLPSGQKSKSPKVVRDQEGFILNQLPPAMDEAKRSGKLVLIDFTASWCPACIRLIHESFKSAEFKKSSAPYVLVKVDVDLEQNQDLLSRYSIRAFPTIVITNASGDEIDRILDYLPAEALAQRLSEISKNRGQTLVDLKKKAESGDKTAAMSLGRNAFLAQQTEECVAWFEKSGQRPIEYYQCLMDQKAKGSPEEHLAGLRQAIDTFPESFYSIDWRLRITEILKGDDKQKEKYNSNLAEAEKLTGKWLSEPERIRQAFAQNQLIELKGLIEPELHYSLGAIYEAQGKGEDAKKHFELAIAKTMELKPSSENPTIIIYLVHYLKKTRPQAEALAWLEKLVKAYPKDFTYRQRQASLLFEAKEFKSALPVAEQAFELSYGTNRLKTGMLLAKIHKELSQKTTAVQVLQSLEASEAARLAGNKHHLEKIQKALKELR
jgi:thiol-disulfide isomerase/thioredoxin